MSTITAWWSYLPVFSQVFWGIALFGSVFLILQVILMFIGLEHDGDFDHSVETHDGSHGFLTGLNIFTLRNMIAFLCMFGWTGVVMIGNGSSYIATCIVATIVGLFSSLIMALFMKFLYSLQASGNTDENSLVGKQAMVYIVIPEKGKGIGKINFVTGSKVLERQAISSDKEIPYGVIVKTISYTNNIFTVERV